MKRVIRTASSTGTEYTSKDGQRKKYYTDDRGCHIFEGPNGTKEMEFPTDDESTKYLYDPSEPGSSEPTTPPTLPDSDNKYYILRYDGSTSYLCKGSRWKYSVTKDDLLLMNKEKAEDKKRALSAKDTNRTYGIQKV